MTKYLVYSAGSHLGGEDAGDVGGCVDPRLRNGVHDAGKHHDALHQLEGLHRFLVGSSGRCSLKDPVDFAVQVAQPLLEGRGPGVFDDEVDQVVQPLGVLGSGPRTSPRPTASAAAR